MASGTPIGGGVYGQAAFVFGANIGVTPDGYGTIGGFTQVGAGVGGAMGGSFTYGQNGWEFGSYQAVGLATPSGLPGGTFAALYDPSSGHVVANLGYGVADFFEAGVYAEFGSPSDFSNWYEDNFGSPPPIPDNWIPPQPNERAIRASQAIRTSRAIRASQAIRTSRAIRTSQAIRTSRAIRASQAIRTSRAIRTSQAIRTSRAIRTSQAIRTSRAIRTSHLGLGLRLLPLRRATR